MNELTKCNPHTCIRLENGHPCCYCDDDEPCEPCKEANKNV